MAAIVIAQGDRFRIEAEHQSELLILRLIGEIDEDVDLRKLPQYLANLPKSKLTLFDLGKVTKINSCGVREWVLFLESSASQKPFGFLMINELVLHQAAMFPGVLGKPKAGIVAFEVPYFCTHCQKRSIQVVRTQDLKKMAEEYPVPKFDCETCGRALELDALESEYFRFLKLLPQPSA